MTKQIAIRRKVEQWQSLVDLQAGPGLFFLVDDCRESLVSGASLIPCAS